MGLWWSMQWMFQDLILFLHLLVLPERLVLCRPLAMELNNLALCRPLALLALCKPLAVLALRRPR